MEVEMIEVVVGGVRSRERARPTCPELGGWLSQANKQQISGESGWRREVFKLSSIYLDTSRGCYAPFVWSSKLEDCLVSSTSIICVDLRDGSIVEPTLLRSKTEPGKGVISIAREGHEAAKLWSSMRVSRDIGISEVQVAESQLIGKGKNQILASFDKLLQPTTGRVDVRSPGDALYWQRWIHLNNLDKATLEMVPVPSMLVRDRSWGWRRRWARPYIWKIQWRN